MHNIVYFILEQIKSVYSRDALLVWAVCDRRGDNPLSLAIKGSQRLAFLGLCAPLKRAISSERHVAVTPHINLRTCTLYLINQTLCHKFFTEPSNYSLLLAQEFAGIYFRVSTILGQYFIIKYLRTSSNYFAGTSNLELNYRFLIRILSYIYL